MKRTLTRLIALVLALGCIFSLVACSKPKLDLEKAKKNLDDEGYSVSYTEDSSSTGIESTLFGVKDGKQVHVIKYETYKAARLAYQTLKLNTEQEIESLKLQLKIAKYNNSKFDVDNDSTIENLEDSIEELKDQLASIGRSGKYVWYGDKEAIKATK